MDRPELFGRDASSPWREAVDLEDAARLADEYRQHLVAIAVRAYLHREGRTIEEFAAQLKVGARRLGQKLNGSVDVRKGDIYAWVLATDLSVLPEEPHDRAQLLPPTNGTHRVEI